MAFGWTDELLTGNSMIDEQHKVLIKAIVDLLEASKSGNGLNEVKKTVDFLADYTNKHFREEEALQQKYAYPDIENHKKLHAAFVKVVEKIKERINANESLLTISIDVQRAVADWFVNHILREDKKVAKHIQDKAA
ncbi:hemerythrin [Fibrobacterales bacterium]|nr:hemerythrin [Fibrobacterales bacterium]